jgi:hypothetical protein
MKPPLFIEPHRLAASARPCGAGPRAQCQVRGSVAFCLVHCCSLGEACFAGRCVAQPAQPRRRRTVTSFAMRTGVHNLNSMAPCPSARSQPPLCNCCHWPARSAVAWAAAGRGQVLIGLDRRAHRLAVITPWPGPPRRPRARAGSVPGRSWPFLAVPGRSGPVRQPAGAAGYARRPRPAFTKVSRGFPQVRHNRGYP